MRKMKMVEMIGATHQFSRQNLAVREGRDGSCFDLICSSDLRSGQINSSLVL